MPKTDTTVSETQDAPPERVPWGRVALMLDEQRLGDDEKQWAMLGAFLLGAHVAKLTDTATGESVDPAMIDFTGFENVAGNLLGRELDQDTLSSPHALPPPTWIRRLLTFETLGPGVAILRR